MEKETTKKVIRTYSLEAKTVELLDKMAKEDKRKKSAIIDKLIQESAATR